jgi:hypothetical protein
MPALSFPASPSPGALYTVGSRTWVWSGTIWELSATALSAGVVGANELAAGAVTTAKIATDAVTTTNIAALAVTDVKLASNSVTTAKIATNAITAAKLAAGASNSYVLTADSSTTSGVKWSIIPPSGGLSTTTEGAIMTMTIGA